MKTFIMTVHTDDGKAVDFEIEAQTPDDALDLLWEKKYDDWVRIDTNMSLTEFVNANRIVKVSAELKPEPEKPKMLEKPDGFKRG